MEFGKVVQERRSVRKFTPEPLSHEKIEAAVQAASYAPSWKNTQIARYVLIEDKALLSRIADECVMGFAYNASTIKGAPGVMIVTYITGRSGFERDGSFSTSKKDGWEMFDAGIATQTFCLAAQEQGLGSVIMGIFDEAKIIEVAGIAEGQKVAALVAIGTPDEAPAMPKRKTVTDLLTYQ